MRELVEHGLPFFLGMAIWGTGFALSFKSKRSLPEWINLEKPFVFFSVVYLSINASMALALVLRDVLFGRGNEVLLHIKAYVDASVTAWLLFAAAYGVLCALYYILTSKLPLESSVRQKGWRDLFNNEWLFTVISLVILVAIIVMYRESCEVDGFLMLKQISDFLGSD